MPWDIIAHLRQEQAAHAQSRRASPGYTAYAEKESGFKEAADYLSQRANFVGEFDRIKNDNEKLFQVAEERGRDVERLTKERDASKLFEQVAEERGRDVERLTKERAARQPGQVRPPDYDEMKASTRAWHGAITKVLHKDGYLTIKAEHDQIMNNWVEQRGDGLSPNDYDYLVYSRAIGWEKALKKKKVSVANCQDIKNKFIDAMSLLFDD